MSSPRMPHHLKKVYSEIFNHPKFSDLSEGTQVALKYGCAAGFSHHLKPNSQFARAYWKHLYLGEPEPA
jgi:hypothetical protein